MPVIGDTKGRIGEVTDKVRERRMEGRVDDLDRENLQLRTEVRDLRGELAHERSLLEDALEGLRERPTPTVVKKKRRGGMLRTVVIGGGAYLLGTRAGRERYDQIMGWIGRKRDEMVLRREETSSDTTMIPEGTAGNSRAAAEGFGS